MTDKPTPTDAELEALLLYKLPASKHYIRPVIEKMVAAMQAAIDKWGRPTQTQAGAVPLTCEWTHNEDDGFWETACGEAWRFDDGGPGENNMHFCHSCGNSLRIKGGQHGAK